MSPPHGSGPFLQTGQTLHAQTETGPFSQMGTTGSPQFPTQPLGNINEAGAATALPLGIRIELQKVRNNDWRIYNGDMTRNNGDVTICQRK